MANNQLLASDNFASGSLAAGWAAAFGKATSIVTGSPFVAEPDSTSIAGWQIWTGLTWPADQTSELTIAALSQIAGTNIALLVRFQTGSLSGYAAILVNSTATIFRYDAGATTSLATVGSLTIAAGDVWSFQAAGPNLLLYQNGKLILNVADINYTSGSTGFSQQSTTAIVDSKVGSWRGYSAVQQDGIWQKQGVIVPEIVGDLQVGLQNFAMLYESNAQILSGTVFKMWFQGGVTGTFYAESTDGVAFTRKSGAVISSQGYPFVIKVGSTYYLYTQTANSGGSANFSRYHSADGVSWSLDSNNVFGLGAIGQWDHNIIWYFQPVAVISGTWYALYCAANGALSATPLKLGLATSSDGLTWTRYAGNPVLTPANGGSAVNSQALVKIGNLWYMWMFSNQPGQGVGFLDPGEGALYSTPDFINWTFVHNSVHRSQLYEGLNAPHGQSYPNNIFDVGGKAYMYIQSTPFNSGTNQNFIGTLAIGPAPIASIVTKNEDGVAQVAADAFTGGVGDLSANWSVPSSGFTKLQIIAGNLVEATATSTVCGSRYVGATFGDNQYSEATIHALGSGQIFELTVRGTAGGDIYAVEIVGPMGSAVSTNNGIQKKISGVTTTLNPHPFTMTANVGDVFRLQVITGSDGFPVLSLYQNGFLLLQAIDYSNALPSGGAPGFLLYTTVLAQAQVSGWAGGNANVIPSYGPVAGESFFCAEANEWVASGCTVATPGGLVAPPAYPAFDPRSNQWIKSGNYGDAAVTGPTFDKGINAWISAGTKPTV